MKKRTLYVTDLDGTLLGNDSRISGFSRKMLDTLARKGVMVTAATARTPATVQPIFKGIEPAFYTDSKGGRHTLPTIVMTGAGLWNRAECKFEKCHFIPENEAHQIYTTIRKEGLQPFVYCLEDDGVLNVYHSMQMNTLESGFYNERSNLTLKRFHLDKLPESWGKVVLFFSIGNVTAVERACNALRSVTDCAAAWYPDVFVPETGLIDLYAAGVSKARAVTELAARTDADEVVVFGDNLNDLPMMRVADVAVAVGNAFPRVKDSAHAVIGSNTADSVVKFICDREL